MQNKYYVEERVSNLITFAQISHLEVPLSKLQETRDKLRQVNLQIPVIPLEVGDYKMHQKPLQELAYSLDN